MASRTIHAFQLQSTTTRTIVSSLSSNKNPATELFASEKGSESESNEETGRLEIVSEGFGESVPYVPLSERSEQKSSSGESDLFSVGTETAINEVELIKQSRMRNTAVAIASFAFAIFNYGWQFAHPVTAIEILASMEKQSAPLAAIGNNGKPTVIDFWAPWCENCRVAAPTLQAVEKEYGDQVNFIMVNADDGRNWPLIQLFGVDAIPHFALVSGEGDVETALIGPMTRNVLRADIDALLNKREDCAVKEVVQPVCHDELPYKMYDAFGNRQWDRRINFEKAMQ